MIGTRIAHYRIAAELGAGGMGVVYRAHDETLGRDVALKFPPGELAPNEDARRQLIHEARAAASLNHPNICTVYEVGEWEGQAYIAMELLEGRSLGERIAATSLPAETVLDYGIQIADALAHAHDHGVVHRDLKPANVVIFTDGRVKVCDFGIARRIAPVAGAPTLAPTPTGVVSGTPAYLAPEILGGRQAEARSDVWSLGVVLYEMATGRPPFAGETEFAIGAAILNSDPAPLPAQLHAGLRSAILRCLAKDPARRYGRAGEVRAALEAIREDKLGAVAVATVPPDAAHKAPAPPPSRAAGSRPRALIAAGALLLVVAVFVGWRLGLRRVGSPGAIRSLAVLPLENLSRDPQQEYFADGMTEELITSLANLEGVSVISRTSTMRYKGTRKGIPQIARELGVDAVIEGSALRAGDEVRISAQLIEAATDRHLWARSYQRSLANVLALQGEVAQAIAAEIRVALTPQGKARVAGAPAVNPAAYEEYLKGRYEWSKRTPEAFRLAIVLFERAIATDSSYAAAWAGLADVYAVMPANLFEPARPRFAKALEAVRNALRLDPHLAEAHATLGMLNYRMEYDWASADSEFRTALALNPSYATVHQWYGLSLAVRGRLDEASAELARALELDPHSTVALFNQGQVFYFQRRHDEAITVLQQAVRSSPGFGGNHVWLGRAYYAKRMHPAALAEFVIADSLENGSLHRDERIRAAVLAGDTRRYMRLAVADGERRAREEYFSPSTLIIGYAQLGDRDRAFHWVETGLEERDFRILTTLRDPMLDPLRSDPRFATILRKYGLEP